MNSRIRQNLTIVLVVGALFLLVKFWPSSAQETLIVELTTEQTFTTISEPTDPIIPNTEILQVQKTNQPCQTEVIESALDIPYQKIKGVDPNELSLDIYYPKGQLCANLPVMIYVHGGGWQDGDKRDKIEGKVKYFTSQGFVFISVNYRISSKINYPVYHQNIATAIAWVRQNIDDYGGDTERLSLVGFSAGADIVALLSTNHRFLDEAQVSPATIRCTLLLDAGGYDIAKLIADRNEVYLKAFGDEAKTSAEASPINYLSLDNYAPRFLIVTRGNLERIGDATYFYSKLLATGHSAQLIWANPLNHLDVRDAVGQTNDDLITPAITDFLLGC